jgi:hypothetical protein
MPALMRTIALILKRCLRLFTTKWCSGISRTGSGNIAQGQRRWSQIRARPGGPGRHSGLPNVQRPHVIMLPCRSQACRQYRPGQISGKAGAESCTLPSALAPADGAVCAVAASDRSCCNRSARIRRLRHFASKGSPGPCLAASLGMRASPSRPAFRPCMSGDWARSCSKGGDHPKGKSTLSISFWLHPKSISAQIIPAKGRFLKSPKVRIVKFIPHLRIKRQPYAVCGVRAL